MKNDFLKDLSEKDREKVKKATEVAMKRVKNGVPFGLALFGPEIIRMVTEKTESEDG